MKTEMGYNHGEHYRLVYDRMCNQGAWLLRCFRWFLSVKYPNGHYEYEGDFGTKKEAMTFLENKGSSTPSALSSSSRRKAEE